LRSAEAFCPAGISSFFEICDTDSTGTKLTNYELVGSRGGGFRIGRGVRARVSVTRSNKSRIDVRINSRRSDANTTCSALMELLKRSGSNYDVRVDVTARVPIAAGYGTSAAGTLASCLALADAAMIPVTFNELGIITHVAEVLNRTGLGTTSALLHGGFGLVLEPGAPGISRVDRLLFPKDHSIICVYFAPILTSDALRRKNVADHVNPAGQRALAAIRERPELSTFLSAARRFSHASGFQTPETRKAIEELIANGAVGAAQNMIGEAVHGVIETSRASRMSKVIRSRFRSAKVFVTNLDDTGLHLL
jgi:pantoate kinase